MVFVADLETTGVVPRAIIVVIFNKTLSSPILSVGRPRIGARPVAFWGPEG